MSKAFTTPHRGIMLVLSSPSGAGKSSIAKALLEGDTNLRPSVSYTTRPKRPAEREGVDYTFVSIDTFSEMIAAGDFLEYAKVFDHYYGTPRAPIDALLHKGHNILFDIDWQGTQQIAQHSRGDLITVFILPPSTQELERRLKSRAQDHEKVVFHRMEKASDEMSHWAEYEYVIVNENLSESIDTVRSILRAEQHKRARQMGLSFFVSALRTGQ